MVDVVLKNIFKSFSGTPVIKGVDLSVGKGEFLVLVGPSGCGKSTLLRLIAGLEQPDQGEILLGGKVMNAQQPQERNVAMVFQNYALYPQMSVEENLSFGLKMKKLPADEIQARVREVSALLRIEKYLARKPKQLSGGQRQRVALGRALARRAPVILFDEPLSNLDAHLRNQMRLEIRRIQRQTGSTVIYVTHDYVEATTLGDRIAILNQGVIEQVDVPERLYRAPANAFVATFIGSPEINLLKGRLEKSKDGGYCWRGKGGLEIDGLKIDGPADYAGGEVSLGVRPEDWKINDKSPNSFAAQVELIESIGPSQVWHLQSDLGFLRAIPPQEGHWQVGEKIHLSPDLARIHLFDLETGRSMKGATH